MPAPKVNVLIVTHNHEQFIGQALESVLAQQVDFPYTVVVGEDCSTDQTRAIVEHYRQRYPDRIRPPYHTYNVGPGANLKACLAACQAPYIAALDGDDYWTDPHKLAKQVAWLEANPAFSLCFHQAEVFQDGREAVQIIPPPTIQTVYTLADILGATVPPTSSVVLRNCLPTLPDWLFETFPIDLPLCALYAEVGKIKLLPEVMGRYRHHAGGTWTAQSAERNQQRLYAMYQRLMQHYTYTPYNHSVKRTISKLQLTRADEHLKQGRSDAAFLVLKQAARLWPSYTPALIKSLLGVSLRWLKNKTATGGPSTG